GLPINWFDFAVVIVIVIGANRGRKHGMSEEMMVMLQWVAIVFAAGFLYRPLGDALSDSSASFSHLACYIATYISIAIVVRIFFTLIKKGTGGKLIGSSVFGQGEYYLGMISGIVRFLCIMLAVLALLNARLYTSQEIAAYTAFQNDVYGSTYFPGLSTLQSGVFKESLMGPLVKQYLGFLLIAETPPEKKGLSRRTVDLP
ncbi:MAG TPA: CvpA family protein, partial [Verrucomicrobiae bacterium]|nr:CvpA family protein [Verrucomicrobiae bacterium]